MTNGGELLTRIDALLPRIAARAGGQDRIRQVAGATIDDLTEAGASAALETKACGRFEDVLDTFSTIVQKIKAVSPCTGWVCSFLRGASWRLLAFGRKGHGAPVKHHAAIVTGFRLGSVNGMALRVGGDGFRDDAPFQGFFHDVITFGRHAFLAPDAAGATCGKAQLGPFFSGHFDLMSPRPT